MWLRVSEFISAPPFGIIITQIFPIYSEDGELSLFQIKTNLKGFVYITKLCIGHSSEELQNPDFINSDNKDKVELINKFSVDELKGLIKQTSINVGSNLFAVLINTEFDKRDKLVEQFSKQELQLLMDNTTIKINDLSGINKINEETKVKPNEFVNGNNENKLINKRHEQISESAIIGLKESVKMDKESETLGLYY